MNATKLRALGYRNIRSKRDGRPPLGSRLIATDGKGRVEFVSARTYWYGDAKGGERVLCWEDPDLENKFICQVNAMPWWKRE